MDPDLATAMAEAAKALHSPPTLQETLDSIVRTAKLSVPGIDAVSISTLERRGQPVTRAGTDDLVWELDRVQYSLDEGPCVQSMERDGTDVVQAPRLRHEQRWPRYVPSAVAQGVLSQLAVKLCLDGTGTVGGLNLYSTSTEDIEHDAVETAQLFAVHAAIALGSAREVDSLNEALRSRKEIGQALGMLMKEFTLTEDAAFGFLMRTSSHTNVKIREIAVRMVKDANARAVTEAHAGSRRAVPDSTVSDMR